MNTFNIVDLINLAIALAIIVAIVLSVYYLFVGGISFILSGGQEDKIKEAVNTIRYAIIGLVMTVLAVVFLYILGNIFGVNVAEKINPDRMLEMAQTVYNRVTATPGGSGSY
ncbi:MAG: hypothetical protein WCJ84_03480 [Candidatus Peregrinibacteria bacterium]